MSHRHHPRDDRASAATVAVASRPLRAAVDALKKGSSSRRRRIRRLAAPAAAIAMAGALSAVAAPGRLRRCRRRPSAAAP